MHAAYKHLEFAPPPTPGILRALGLAVLAHLFLLAALTWGVNWKSDAVTVSAEAELWSAVPKEAAPKLVEAPPPPPEPVVVPRAPKPPQAQALRPDAAIALEREKQQKLKKQAELDKLRLEKLQREKKLQEDKLEKDKAAEEKKKTARDAKRKEELKDKQEAQKLEAQRTANLKRMAGLAGATGGADAKGKDLQSSGPSASYAGRIRGRIKPNIVFTDDIAGNPTAEVAVRTAPDGTIVSSKLVKSSGVKSWDDAVLKAIDKTEVLPRDVDGRVPSALVISFRPKD